MPFFIQSLQDPSTLTASSLASIMFGHILYEEIHIGRKLAYILVAFKLFLGVLWLLLAPFEQKGVLGPFFCFISSCSPIFRTICIFYSINKFSYFQERMLLCAAKLQSKKAKLSQNFPFLVKKLHLKKIHQSKSKLFLDIVSSQFALEVIIIIIQNLPMEQVVFALLRKNKKTLFHW